MTMLRALDVAAGIAILLAALGSWRRSWALAVLCAATATAWFAGDVVPALALVHRPLLVHALLVSTGGAPAASGAVVAALWSRRWSPRPTTAGSS
jgi:acid phosphatase family membrane protein YuiD